MVSGGAEWHTTTDPEGGLAVSKNGLDPKSELTEICLHLHNMLSAPFYPPPPRLSQALDRVHRHIQRGAPELRHLLRGAVKITAHNTS
jgi:hypothetical protein